MDAQNLPDISQNTPTVLVDRSKKHEDRCPICLTDYENVTQLLQHTFCKHTFCPECFFEATEDNNKCPMCRQPFYNPTDVEEYKEELLRRKHTREVETALNNLRQILNEIEQRIEVDEPVVEAARTPFSFVLPYPALKVILNGSKTRLEERMARFGSPSRPTNLYRLKVLAQGLKDAHRSFQIVLDVLTSQQDPDRNVQQHFMAAYSQL